ncbi:MULTISPECIES: DUF2513 domain-containing protein [Nostocales]|uniref:DUF2513 domain-containing protein n=3 Tax=Nostocales TaxID=1161 RepID=A0A0C1QTQ6_9CYAN|nr:DUF2513 domain-containing protein [Tolypothrix bouteillei]KAF3889341.1 DUF2513 domain-containing protein [Tolypothrix bouteillei VB521301]
MLRARDLSLIKEIFLQVENSASGSRRITNLNIKGFDEPTIIDRVDLLIEWNYLKGYVNKTLLGITGYGIDGITMSGYDYLDKIR